MKLRTNEEENKSTGGLMERILSNSNWRFNKKN